MSEIKAHVYESAQSTYYTPAYINDETGLGVPKHYDGAIQARWDEETQRWVQVWVRMDEG